jgi:hypothetical protein
MARQLHTSAVGKLCRRGTCRGMFNPSCPHVHFRGSHFSQAWTAAFYVLATWRVLKWALDGDECSTSHPKRFVPKKRWPGTRWIVSWVGPTVSVVFWRTEKISLPCQEQNLRMYSFWLCFYKYIITAEWSIMCQFKIHLETVHSYYKPCEDQDFTLYH